MQALQYSHDLIKGHWWRSSTILTIAVIIILVFSMVVGLIAGVLAAISRHDVTTAQLVIQVVSMAANVFVLPMIPAVLLVMYRDLQLRREGGDLAARVGALP
jgi:ABC-type antimicrobial peptide transport system permease subunit